MRACYFVIPFSFLFVSARASAPDPAGIEFFENKIRPILVEHCYQCHSSQAEKLKGGLYVDTPEGLRKGGDTGPALIEGNPDKSLLIKAVRYTDENLQMPPKGKKLTSEQIADLEAWIKLGAPDPRGGVAKTAPVNDQAERSRQHWAFQPLRDPPLPRVSNPNWCQSSIDHFILARLDAAQLAPSAPADPATLLRRASFDLLGLPPSGEEMERFRKRRSSFSAVVDGMLESVHYGERWARYWLDIARYADTKGYVFEEERRFPYSYTYRDYVINALNEDLPFDRFLIEQIAADMLPLKDDKRALAALGFLTLGRRFLNNQPDIIDDRIDVVTRGMMGLTVACARCHDHKYDPIPTRDYYSLYGVFASANEPAEKPLLGNATRPNRYDEYVAERAKREQELEKFKEDKTQEVLSKLRRAVGDYLLVVHDSQKAGDENKREKLVRDRKLNPTVATRWKIALESWQKTHHAVFAPWFAFATIPESEFGEKAGELAARFSHNAESNEVLNPLVAQLFAGKPPASLKEVAQRYTTLFADIDAKWRQALPAHAAKSEKGEASVVPPLSDNYEESLRQIIYAKDSPTDLDFNDLRQQFDTPVQQKLRALRRKVDELDATHPGAPPRAMALRENTRPYNPHVFIRGNANNQGPEVPRQFLELLAGPERRPFTNGSGRLELARAIASPDNPLTARVIVNRVWMYHFGAPLVRTPSDFGLRSEPPTHPELLDHLASYLIKEGWSLKKLHRLIMQSSVYQQSSEHRLQAASVDPENRLLWKMNRRRVDFEAMRDTLLAVSGQLDPSVGGRAVDIASDPSPPRRTIYGFVERQNLPGLFRTFDFASPDTTSPQRFATTVPQQALFLMNSPFVIQQARQLAARPDVKKLSSAEERTRRLYQVVYQRDPEEDELALADRFLKGQPNSEQNAATKQGPWQYGYGAFDPESSRITNFNVLPHFTGSAWQGGGTLPDPKLGWVILNAEGGHVGNDLQHAAIRRWVAPRDGIISIKGELHHPSDKGDGVRARIVSSQAGLLGAWTAYHGKAPTLVESVTVRQGESVDFVTDCLNTVSFDSFTWAPAIKYRTDQLNYSPAVKVAWNAKEDFAGPAKTQPQPLDRWEQFAQVLLVGNELFFVD